MSAFELRRSDPCPICSSAHLIHPVRTGLGEKRTHAGTEEGVMSTSGRSSAGKRDRHRDKQSHQKGNASRRERVLEARPRCGIILDGGCALTPLRDNLFLLPCTGTFST